MKKQAQLTKLMMAQVLVMSLLVSCEEETDEVAAPMASSALVVTTDRETGTLSAVDVETHAVMKNFQTIHSDSVCRFDPITGVPFLVHRMGSDAVSVLDAADARSTTAQYSVGAGTNAQDIAVASVQKAYVPRFGDPSILVVHPTDGTELDIIDISPFADEDGNPDASQAVHIDGEIWVSLGRIDPSWAPTEYSSVIVVDTETDTVTEEIKLTGKNPVGIMHYSQAMGGLVLAEVGSWGIPDGGIEILSPKTGVPSGFIVTEQELGGDLSNAVIASKNKGYAVIGAAAGEGSVTKLVSFNPTTGEKLDDLIVSEGWHLESLSLTPNGEELWVTDRTPDSPGIRIFATVDDTEVTEGPIDVGLPPSMVCFVE